MHEEELDVTAVRSSEPAAAGSASGTVRGLREPRSTLDRLLVGVTTRRLAPSQPSTSVADWRTDDLFVLTTRPRS